MEKIVDFQLTLEKMRESTMFPIYQTISFWICVALFIYVTGNFFFITLSSPTNSPGIRQQLQLIYVFVNVVKNILYCVAFFGNEPLDSNKTDEFMFPSNINLDDLPPSNFKN